MFSRDGRTKPGRGSPFGVVLIEEGGEVGSPRYHMQSARPRGCPDNSASGRPHEHRHPGRAKIPDRLDGPKTAVYDRVDRGDRGERRSRRSDRPDVGQRGPGGIRRLLSITRRAPGGWLGKDETPDDARELSYFAPETAEFELIIKQQILEIPLTSPRLERELEALQSARARMRRVLEARNPISGARLN